MTARAVEVDVTVTRLGDGAVQLKLSCGEVYLVADMECGSAIDTALAILNYAGITRVEIDQRAGVAAWTGR